MTDPTAHWSPSEVDDGDDRASYPPPAFRDGERDPSVIAAYARAEMDRLASDNPDLATAWSDVERAALALVRSSIGASGLLDLDAIEARWRNATKGPWKLTQVRGFGATNIIVSEHPEASWYCVVAIVHNAGGSDAMNAMAAARTDVPALVARVRELEAALATTEAEARTALDALHKRCDAAEAEVGRLRAEVAAAQPVLMLDAAAGESFAAEHPYAAGAIMGGIAHRSEVSK